MLRTEKEAECIPKEVLVKWMVKEETLASKKKCKHEGKPGKLSAETPEELDFDDVAFRQLST